MKQDALLQKAEAELDGQILLRLLLYEGRGARLAGPKGGLPGDSTWHGLPSLPAPR